MTWVRSFLFNVYFYIWLPVMLVVMLFALPFPRRAMQDVVRVWAHGTQWGLGRIIGLNYRVVGRENLPDGAFIIASKHQSLWETYIYHVLFTDACYVMKKELLNIPLWGWYARKCQSVAVDREGGGAALKKMVRDSLSALEAGRPLVIFPEGTRTPPGEHRPYFPGIAALYSRSPVPLVPVALNSGVFWGRRSFQKRPGVITLEFLAPIPPGLDRRAFMTELESRVESASDKLIQEAESASG